MKLHNLSDDEYGTRVRTLCPNIRITPGGRGGLVVKSRPQDRSVAGSKPNSLKIRRVWGLLHAKSYIVAKRPPVGVARKFGEEGASSDVVLVI
ncbi:hypothetical protein AVEN_234424-1 [Araneus ventricosus]|uniref:Uncharacterized protein n=1 Tax=Araneus ventricosus TaxID=182803 RepID=A0A4Y2AA57_ARAVE|nr:hypothetical protein AVEN_234424-1 [Araneus ventricosus]